MAVQLKQPERVRGEPVVGGGIDDLAGALFAEHLIVIFAAHRVCVPDDEHQRIVSRLGLLRGGAELRLSCFRQRPFAGVEIDVGCAFDVILVDIAHAAAQRFGRSGLFGKLLGRADADHVRGLKVTALEADLAGDQAAV